MLGTVREDTDILQSGKRSRNMPGTARVVSVGRLHVMTANSEAVNSIAWAPYELGAILACASSDGNVSVLQFKSECPSPDADQY